MKFRRALHVSAAFAAISIGTSAAAQDASVDQAADGSLEEIVVTAQRRSETLQDVPIAIAAIRAETLQATSWSETVWGRNLTNEAVQAIATTQAAGGDLRL